MHSPNLFFFKNRAQERFWSLVGAYGKAMPFPLLQMKSRTAIPERMDGTTSYASWIKYTVLRSHIERMRVRQKRRVFHIMRTADMHADIFLPEHGFTLGEFSCFQVLGDSARRSGGR